MKKVSLALLIPLALGLAACGKEDVTSAVPAPTASAPAAAAAPAPAPAANPLGGTVFNKACGLCHAAGVAGAPKPGDRDDWAPRIAQGDEVLYKHAIEGFTGSKGAMPPRGGSPSLSDEEVKAAVDYMVERSR